MHNFLASQPKRMTRMEAMMLEVRKNRDKDLSHKKLTEIRLLQSGKLSHVKFGGA